MFVLRTDKIKWHIDEVDDTGFTVNSYIDCCDYEDFSSLQYLIHEYNPAFLTDSDHYDFVFYVECLNVCVIILEKFLKFLDNT